MEKSKKVKYEVKKSEEKDFDLNTCFMEKFIKEENYQKYENDSYFDSYSHFAIHEEMLKDRV